MQQGYYLDFPLGRDTQPCEGRSEGAKKALFEAAKAKVDGRNVR